MVICFHRQNDEFDSAPYLIYIRASFHHSANCSCYTILPTGSVKELLFVCLFVVAVSFWVVCFCFLLFLCSSYTLISFTD